MRIALAVPLLLLALPTVPGASAELECGGDPEHPCEVGPCAEFYQDGSALVVDPGTVTCYDRQGAAVVGWLAAVTKWLECQVFYDWCGPMPPLPEVPVGPSSYSAAADANAVDWLFDFVDWVECVHGKGGIECGSPPPPRLQ